MEVITRKEAKELGSLFYFTGLACPYGHTTMRYTKTSNCVTCHAIYYASDEQKNKQKEYRETHKEKKSYLR